MEKSEYSFGAYRYFIVPNDQISLFDAIEEKRKKAVQNFFSALVEEKKRSWEIKGRKHLATLLHLPYAERGSPHAVLCVL